jgi:hypothetical protein
LERGDVLAGAIDLVGGVGAFEDNANIAGGEKAGVREGARILDNLDTVSAAEIS